MIKNNFFIFICHHTLRYTTSPMLFSSVSNYGQQSSRRGTRTFDTSYKYDVLYFLWNFYNDVGLLIFFRTEYNKPVVATRSSIASSNTSGWGGGLTHSHAVSIAEYEKTVVISSCENSWWSVTILPAVRRCRRPGRIIGFFVLWRVAIICKRGVAASCRLLVFRVQQFKRTRKQYFENISDTIDAVQLESSYYVSEKLFLWIIVILLSAAESPPHHSGGGTLWIITVAKLRLA